MITLRFRILAYVIILRFSSMILSFQQKFAEYHVFNLSADDVFLQVFVFLVKD